MFAILFYNINSCSSDNNYSHASGITTGTAIKKNDKIIIPQLVDTILYNKKMQQLENGDRSGLWPPNASYPQKDALLPFNRIVAYYGNFFSKNMGVFGEYSPDKMIEKLQSEIKVWENADTLTPVIPAIHYIAVTAQHSPGADGKYRLCMP